MAGVLQNFINHRLPAISAAWLNLVDKIKVTYDRADIEISANITPTNTGYPPFNVLRYGCTNNGVDCTAALQAVANKLPYLFFPAGTYRISSTITRMNNSRWVGEIPQMLQNGSGSVTPEVVIFGPVAGIGNGNPMVRMTVAGVQGNSCHTSWIGFKSDKAVDPGNLSIMDANGVNGIDISSIKNSVEFVNCSFDHMAMAIVQDAADPFYVDQLTLECTHIQSCYRATNAKPVTGISMAFTTIFDCFDFIDTVTDVIAYCCSLNNTSFASENTSVEARNIRWYGGWVEGGNNIFRYTQSLLLDGLYASETFSALGTTKFLLSPVNNNTSAIVRNLRVPTNTRLISLTGLTLSTTHLEVYGAYDGINFAATADIQTSLDAGLDYRGSGNKNTPVSPAVSWNIDNQIRNAQNANYTFTALDHKRLVYHSSGTPHTWTIDSNANLALPLNTQIHLVNQGAGAVTIAITTDTLRWQASTGSRTLAQNGSCTLRKTASTEWRIVNFDGVS